MIFNFRKDQMVLKVQDYHKPQLLKDVEREKKNMMYCMRPAVSVVSHTLFINEMCFRLKLEKI